ncbi:MAG TPA: 3-deoxy-7-phosphoheptulonate synthase [Haliangiales bacterium]|nr:3-deoxy-7-phosphoheptulonate synthase [Haliangiales bacterium]
MTAGNYILTLAPGADAKAVVRELVRRGLWVKATDGAQLLVLPHSAAVAPASLGDVPGVVAVAAPPSEHPRVDAHPPRIDVAGVPFGGGAPPVLLAGPCAVESEEQIAATARAAARAGAKFLRGGAFKPRTSPYAFSGHGAEALAWLRRAADAVGLRVVTEVLSEADVPAVAAAADLIQIGSRNMQNFALLRAAARAGKPLLLKRGMAATIEEWLLAAEHCLHHGAPSVVFCERGIRGFDPSTRNLLDLGAVALLAHVHRLPVVCDPSHAAGRRDLVVPLGRAALAAGAAGLLVEIHERPGEALSDGPQALPPAALPAFLEVAHG